MDSHIRFAITAIVVGVAAACATGAEPTETQVAEPVEGEGGEDGSGGAATGGSALACDVDCSTVAAPDCMRAVCNESQGRCEIVAAEDGEACDDGLFCTISDSCQAGTCVGGPPNDCGMTPPQCTEVTCNNDTQTCSTAPADNGAACQDPNNLCQQGMTCNNGLCIGGSLQDCFFFPVMDDCHVAACDPQDGMCKDQIGNEGEPCIDQMDLCTVDKTCTTGVCQGGTPKDCSNLTAGCSLGVCESNTGMCTTQPVMNGQSCDDLNACTAGEICTNMTCGGGAPVTSCSQTADGCCPSNCNAVNDLDCAILPSCKDIKLASPSSPDGIYTIDPDGPGPAGQTSVYCDMTTDGGGWLLGLSYYHVGGQNVALSPGAPPTDPSNGYAHADLAWLSAFNFSELRLYCDSSAHNRIIHFKTSVPGAVSYFHGTSTNDASYWTSGFTLLAGHSASLPAGVTHGYDHTGEDRMTDFPFFSYSQRHWGIHGLGNRWECDDYASGPQNTTQHRVWLR